LTLRDIADWQKLTLAQGEAAADFIMAATNVPRKEAGMPTVVTQPSKVTTPVVKPSVFLTPDRVAKMLSERRSFQIVKFRTNCSDCVPNL